MMTKLSYTYIMMMSMRKTQNHSLMSSPLNFGWNWAQGRH